MENENNVISDETNVNVVDENDKKEIDNQEFSDSIEKPEETQPIRKKKTKRILSVIFVCVLIIGLIVAYFKLNENVFKVEKMIDNIGEVTLDSKEDIKKAEEAYNALSNSEKKRVDNIGTFKESKKTYSNLLIESFETSSEYSQLKSTISTYMALYNPEITFDKEKKTVTINLYVDSDIEELLRYYPTLAKPTWNQVVKNLNDLGKSCYDVVKDHGIDVVLKMYPENSRYLLLFESLNGETQFDILD